MNEASKPKADPAAALLPAGLRDVLPPRAGWEAALTEKLLADFARSGYRRIKPPLLEFEETLLAGFGQSLAPQMFRLMDPVSQRMMGLRTDITLQVARIAASRLGHAPRPLRLSYAGQVLRVRGTQLRPERQFAQAGVELIGSEALAADVEIALLAAESLLALGVKNLSIDLTQPLLVPAVCAGFGLEARAAKKARVALDRKDSGALRDAAGPANKVLQSLLAAWGPADRALEALTLLDLPAEAAAMVRQLEELVRQVNAAAPELLITLDPGEFRGFEYHTGISFSLFARGVRGELGRGGRYSAGPAQEPATGFTLYLDSLMRALPAPEDGSLVYVPHGAKRENVRRLHADGWATLQGLAAAAKPEAEAKRLGCSHVLRNGKVEEL